MAVSKELFLRSEALMVNVYDSTEQTHIIFSSDTNFKTFNLVEKLDIMVILFFKDFSSYNCLRKSLFFSTHFLPAVWYFFYFWNSAFSVFWVPMKRPLILWKWLDRDPILVVLWHFWWLYTYLLCFYFKDSEDSQHILT